MSGTGGLVGGVVGAVIGFTFGNPQIGWLVGSSIGGLVAGGPHTSGPQLADLRPQASEYGRPIPIIYSVMAVGGNVIWASDLVKTSDGDGGGGKGGGGGGGTGPTYAANFDVLICESDGTKTLGRIWAGPDKRLIYDPGTGTLESGTLRFYSGAEDQLPDPLEESYLGTGNVPAYRGYARVVLEGFDVSAHDGNRIPFLTIEVGASGEAAPDTLGNIWIFQTMNMDGTQWAVFFHGTTNGFVIRDFANYGFVHERVYANAEWPSFSGRFAYEPATQTFVVAAGGLAYNSYSIANGTLTEHVITTPEGADANAGTSFDTVVTYDGDIIGVGHSAVTGGVTLWVIDPATATCTACYTGSLPSGYSIDSSCVLVPPDSGAGYVISVMESGSTLKAVKLFVGTGVVVDEIGVLAPNCALGWDVAIDPLTGAVWSVSKSAGVLYVRGIDADTHTVLFDAAYDAPNFSLAPNGRSPISFGPSNIGTSVVVITGGWGDGTITGSNFDGYVVINDLGIGYVTGFGPAKGDENCSQALNYLQGQLWNPARSEWFGIRRFGLITPAMSPSDPASTDWRYYDAAGHTCAINPGAFNIALPDTTWTPHYLTLQAVLTDLSARAGLDASQIGFIGDFSDQVDGYTIANQVSVKDAISTLMPAYYFDAVEDQGSLWFVKRGGAIAVEIPDDDLGAHASGEDVVDLIEQTRGQDEELPRTLSVNYILAATKYSPATKYARRLIGNSGDEARLEMPLVFTDQKAQEIAQVNLHEQWVGRIKYKLSLGRKYSYLMPTDIVGVQGYVMRLVRQTTKDNGVIEFEAVHDDSDTYTPNVIVEETPPPDEAVNIPTLTLLELMSINMLRDADDDPGFYAAACAADPDVASWPGCTVFASADGGTTYAVALSITGEATMGVTTDALANFDGGNNIPDGISHVNVALSNGSLSSTTYAGLLAGVNTAVIGDEIVYFQDATLETDGSYTLRGFLRGRRGSEYAMGSHAEGDRFVLVDFAKLVRVAQSTGDIGANKLYKPVTVGRTLASATAKEFTNEGTGLKPHAPVHLGGGRDADGNATLNWTRCNRTSFEWRDAVDVPMTEASEAYEIEILDGPDGAVLRTISGLTTPTASYSAAQQTTDGLTPGDPIHFRVYQRSAVVGRGHPADGTI